jgi:prepilin-type N-terminal cleavage/methylation domain-containing protein
VITTTDRGRKGFTLIELLVVLGVIAVLAALSNVALQHALQASRSAACLSNLHQIYIALQGYSGDNNGNLPVMLPLRASVNDSGPTLDTVLVPSYISDPSVFHCPADASLFAQSGSSYLWDYGYSVNANGQQNDSMIAPTFPLLSTTSLSQIPFVSDKESFHKTNPASHIIYADGHAQ